jgi:propionyl-CoA synthetase
MMDVPAGYRESIERPGQFWMRAAQSISWYVAPTQAFAAGKHGLLQWYPGASLNTCFNAVDRHVLAGRGNQPALIYDSPVTAAVRRFSFVELKREVERLAGAIQAQGVTRGDRVVIYMPMVPEAVFAMLACARIGAVHSVVFGGFAAAELAKRIDDAKPRLVLSASCGIEPNRIVAYKPLLDAALERSSHVVQRILVLQRPEMPATLRAPRDRDWQEVVAGAAAADCVPLDAADPLYILYTSGTTGIPKGVVRDNGGHAVALASSIYDVFGAAPGEVFWAGSDIGWVVGHSYIVYGPLLAGCTTILYEGKPVGTPDAGAFWRVCRDHGVQTLFTSPTALRAIKREDPEAQAVAKDGTGSLRALFLAGERADPATVQWAESHLHLPVVDNWWQTELGWPALATCLGLGEHQVRHGSAGRPVPGFCFEVLNADGVAQPAGGIGDICLRLPLPPGCLTTLWHNEAGFESSYLTARPGFYFTGDSGFIDSDGFVHVMSRVDDLINVAGHRLSSGGIEQVMAAHPDVAECAVVGAADDIKGMVPLGLLVLKAGVTRDSATIAEEVAQRIREEIGPIAACRAIVVLDKLPKTRSGKVLRSVIRKIADNESFDTPPTIEDPHALELVRAALSAAGYNRREVFHAAQS